MLRPFEGLRVNARAGQHILLSHVQPLGQRFSGFLNPLTFPTMPRLLGSHFGSAGRAIETGVDSSILSFDTMPVSPPTGECPGPAAWQERLDRAPAALSKVQ